MSYVTYGWPLKHAAKIERQNLNCKTILKEKSTIIFLMNFTFLRQIYNSFVWKQLGYLVGWCQVWLMNLFICKGDRCKMKFANIQSSWETHLINLPWQIKNHFTKPTLLQTRMPAWMPNILIHSPFKIRSFLCSDLWWLGIRMIGTIAGASHNYSKTDPEHRNPRWHLLGWI